MTNVEEIYEQILKNINEEEKKHSTYLLYKNNNFFEYKSYCNKKNLCLSIKIKDNRKAYFIQLFDSLSINHKIINDDKYRTVFELNSKSNYIILDYVVNSHIIIPNSFLEHFGYKTENGMMINYIDINDFKIKTEKTKEYGIEYGYYSKYTEEILRNRFESRIGEITKEIEMFKNNKINSIKMNSSKTNDILDFFDITTYRNQNTLKQFNESQTVSRILLGNITHNQLLGFVIKDLPHLYKDLKVNFIINTTNRDFIINDTMISLITLNQKEKITILPFNKKCCLALMEENYYANFYNNGGLHPMGINNESDVELINKHIFERAKRNNENVIGTREELEILLKQTYE